MCTNSHCIYDSHLFKHGASLDQSKDSILCSTAQSYHLLKKVREWLVLGRLRPFFHIDMGVSENSGTPKSSILIGFSIINHPFLGTPIFGNTHIYIVKITDDRSTRNSTATKPPSFGRDSAFGVRPGKRGELSQVPPAHAMTT